MLCLRGNDEIAKPSTSDFSLPWDKSPSGGAEIKSIESEPLDSNSQSTWSSSLTPFIHGALQYGSYSRNDISNHLDFFNQRACGWLGQQPPRSLDSAPWRSFMTNDFTPVELSLCWKSRKQNGRPIIRHVTDVAPQPPSADRFSSYDRGINALVELHSITTSPSPCYDLEVDCPLWISVSKIIRQQERQFHANCADCSPSTTFIGFDLDSNKARGKVYWILPSCMSTSKLGDILDHVFSCNLDPLFSLPSFLNSWRSIRDYIESCDEMVRPTMLSIDRTKSTSPRVKIYSRCSLATSNVEEVMRHLTLGDLVPLAEEFKSTVSSLWDALLTRDAVQTHGPSYCVIFHELYTDPGSSNVQLISKLYIPLQEIRRPDSFIARQISEHCKVTEGAEFLRDFSNEKSSTAFFTYVGLGPRKHDTETAIYFNPSMFSRHKWEDSGAELSKLSFPF